MQSTVHTWTDLDLSDSYLDHVFLEPFSPLATPFLVHLDRAEEMQTENSASCTQAQRKGSSFYRRHRQNFNETRDDRTKICMGARSPWVF